MIQALIPSQQQGAYYTQPLYAAPPHVIHHTTVVQPNGMPAAMYAPPIHPPRHNGVAMGMVAGTTMAMSAGEPQFLSRFIVFVALSPSPMVPNETFYWDFAVRDEIFTLFTVSLRYFFLINRYGLSPSSTGYYTVEFHLISKSGAK